MFITFEGTEGSGKSTLIRTLSEKLTLAGIDHITTREPGGTSVAEGIRKVILDHEMGSLTELFLYEAARAEHFEKTVLPALKKKQIVLCDRFTDSTIAYQGFARKLNLKLIDQLNKIATHSRAPDLTFFLDIPVEQGLARATNPNRFENEGLAFQKTVRRGFLYSIKKHPRRWRVLKVAKKTPDQLADEVLAQMRLRSKGRK